jgi:hypothetical protein
MAHWISNATDWHPEYRIRVLIVFYDDNGYVNAPMYYVFIQITHFVNINFYYLTIYLSTRQYTIENVSNDINDENKCIVNSPQQ